MRQCLVCLLNIIFKLQRDFRSAKHHNVSVACRGETITICVEEALAGIGDATPPSTALSGTYAPARARTSTFSGLLAAQGVQFDSTA